jgi:hypothetical protein
MATLHIEKLGGLANFGGTRSRLKSQGQLDTKELTAKEQKQVDSLFERQGDWEPGEGADGFRFRISRTTEAGTETIEAPEASVPAAIASCVKDEII